MSKKLIIIGLIILLSLSALFALSVKIASTIIGAGEAALSEQEGGWTGRGKGDDSRLKGNDQSVAIFS